MHDAIIPTESAGAALEELFANELVDRTLKIERDERFVRVPLLTNSLPESLMKKYGIRMEKGGHKARSVRKIPLDIIRERLQKSGLSNVQISLLPDKWELLGDVLILRLEEPLLKNVRMIASAYADVLGAKSVLRDLGNIHGEERLPDVELILGRDTETVHVENGIKYSLDAARIMFSSGNIDERIRMAALDCQGKVVLDMFAGIGYFSLPIAVYANPLRIYACEMRELSYRYLLESIELNKVDRIVIPILGDNREFVPPEPMDIIIMGYLKENQEFLPKALSCLKSGGRIIYHENCPNELFPRRTLENMRGSAGGGWTMKVLSKRIVKSFAPGVSHVVIDAQFTVA